MKLSKSFRGATIGGMGLAEDAFERLRRITFEGEYVERMAVLGTRTKLSPGVIKTLMRLAKEDGVSMGEMARGIGVRPLLRHGARRRPRRAGPGPARARALRPPGEDHRADRRRPEAGAGDRRRRCRCRRPRSRPCHRPSCASCATCSARCWRRGRPSTPHRRRSPPPLLRATTPSSSAPPRSWGLDHGTPQPSPLIARAPGISQSRPSIGLTIPLINASITATISVTNEDDRPLEFCSNASNWKIV